MPYLPIADYGIIGNMRTAALIGVNGSIDWFCLPRFDSPSVFGALLDDRIGGRFQICPLHEQYSEKQFYWPDTNVLVTRFSNSDGVGEITDYMPPGSTADRGQLIRRVSMVRGTMRFRMHCQPAFDYARQEHEIEISESGAAFHSPTLSLGLVASMPLTAVEKAAQAEFTLKDGEEAVFVLRMIERGEDWRNGFTPARTQALFEATVNYWHRWLSQCTYTGRWRETVYRSALALKLMTYEPTGAIVAAPTTSLPEGIGGERNWDYRYTWLRDAAFTLYGFMRIGFTQEAGAFMDWLYERTYELGPDDPMQPLYGIDGRHVIHEETLDHLEGYMGSRPVRVGNAAYKQFQLDIYGAVMDSVYLYNKYGTFISYDLWKQLEKMINWVSENWHRKDLGIWEVRSQMQHFVYSKLMCWVALDRGVRLADKRSFPSKRDEWMHARDRIYEEIMSHGWNAKRKAFTQHYDTNALDASNLIMPMVFFTAPQDNRMLQTIEAMTEPIAKGGLMSGEMIYRYNIHEAPDGLSGEEGSFNMCTFWLVEALTRAGQLDKARLLFERMLTYQNHLGLYGEQTGLSGEILGNFPQAFTHLGLISAAFNLDRAFNSTRRRE
ncbi:MAG: glycoside hydrolase family 15 protein [Anaerolineae bacterium]|nr:glycoside hydrolase family 15 protein [Anaerolineae bacterium]